MDSIARVKRNSRRHYEAHRDEVLAKRHERYMAHREEIAAYNKEYRKMHGERLRAAGRRYYQTHKEQNQLASKKYYAAHKREQKNGILKRTYGISMSDFEAMQESQSGKCAICGSDKTLVVDHNHTTGKIRALLCNQCNTAVGLLQESPDIARATAVYLEAHNGD
jgi:hypothetical protein